MAIGGPATPVHRADDIMIARTPERKLSLTGTASTSAVGPTPENNHKRGDDVVPSTVSAYPWPIGSRMPSRGAKRIGPFTIGDKIGEGSCATVRKAYRTGYKTAAYACKVLPRVGERDNASVLNPLREISLHRLCSSHPNVVGIEAVAGDDTNHYMFQHLANSGDLFDLLDKLRTNPRETDVSKFFKGILEGLAHCHAVGVAHRDIKIENVLLEKEGEGGGFGLRPMLCDFGFATTDEWSSDACGTLDYAAPEVLKAKVRPYQPQKSDVWSAGVVLYVILVGSLPFEVANNSKREIRRRILNGAFDIPRHVSKEATELLQMMLNPNPDLRSTAEECLRAAFFSGGG